MSKRVKVFVRSCLAIAIVMMTGSLVDQARAADPRIEFELTDEPGSWFRNKAGGGSLAVATPGTEVRFSGNSNTVHTRTSLIFPTGAANMPFDTAPRKGSDSVVLRTPGLYVFTCKIHPYMFGAVIVDDPATAGLDLGENISLVNGIHVPTASDLAVRLLRTFFIATNSANWKDYSVGGNWNVSFPAVTVRVTGGLTLTIDQAMAAFGLANNTPKEALFKPADAVGEVWVDTQFEKTSGKSKPGTATAINGTSNNGTSWEVRRKVALPQINMNNPHNMWTDRDQNLIYQTQWFDSKLTVFNRLTGSLLNNISVGESPSHVMTRVDTDQLHVALNGSANNDSVVELAPLANGVQRRINIGRGNPHAHWMSHDGKLMVTPNAFSADSTQYSFAGDTIEGIFDAGALPIATGMTPDSKFTYVASLLNSTITVINTQTKAVVTTINLLEKYDPVGGCPSSAFYQGLPGKDCSFVGALPIQTPVAPDGKSMVTANTLSGTITVVDPATNTVVKTLPCDPGCHGVQYGAKKGGGYYAYVSSKFSNALIVVGFNASGDAASAQIVGRILLASTATTAADDAVTGNLGMGGQGILTIPVVYNGWVQNLPQTWKSQLHPSHLTPLTSTP